MMDAIFIFGAKYIIYLTLVVTAFYFFSLSKEDRKKFIIFGVIVLPLTYIIAKIAGHFYFDPRPFVVGHFTPLIPHTSDNGFPSDHVLLVSAIASVLFPFKKLGSLILWLCAICIGISRVYVGVHHPVDVIGSIVISIAVMMIIYSVLKQHTNMIPLGRSKLK